MPQATAQSSAPSASQEQRKLKWSIDRIDLADAQIMFIDKAVKPGQDTIYSATLNGSMKRAESGNAFSASFTGNIGAGKAKSATLKIEGDFHLTPDMTALAEGKAQVTAQSLPLSSLEVYIPKTAWMAKLFHSADIAAQVAFTKDKPSRIKLQTSMFVAENQPKNLEIEADLLTNDRSSGLDEAQAVVSVQTLPVGVFKDHLPTGIPIDPDAGTVKGVWRVQWNKATWKAQGEAQLDNIITKGLVKNTPPMLQATAKLSADESTFEVSRLEVSDGKHKVSAEGVVSHPWEPSRSVDLKLDFTVVPEFLKSWGIQIPKGLKYTGSVPVRGELRGALDSPQIDVGANLKEADIAWEDYLEKGKGAPGSVNARTVLVLGAAKPHLKPIAVKISLADARLKAPQHRPLKAAVLLDAQAVVKANTVDLREAVLQLKRGKESPDTVHGEALNLGSSTPSFDGYASFTVDQELIDALGPLPPELVVSGRSQVKAKFSGARGKMTCSAEAPLLHLDVAFGKGFRKLSGVAGSLKASFRIADESVDLSEGALTLPGVLINARGSLRDTTGKFHDVNLEIKKCELRELAKLFPQLSSVKPAGSLEGQVDLKNANNQVLPFGIIRLSGVEIKPENLGVHFSGIKGSLEASGGAMNIPEIGGAVGGAVEGPFTIKGVLENIQNAQALSGKMSLKGGPGHIRSQKLRNVLQQASLILSMPVAPGADKNSDPLGFEKLTGTFDLKNGVMNSENLKFKGAALNAGAIGNLTLKGSELDAYMGIKTMTTLGGAIGRIPAVQKILKQNNGLLKSTGLDKELKRWGINVSEDKKPEGSDQQDGSEGGAQNPEPKATPLMLFLRVRGQAAAPDITPVVETPANRAWIDKLKPLID